MPGTTPNYAFPYPLPADPADMPEALRTLAEAIDGNLRFWEDRARPRYMAQFLGTIPNTIPGTSTLGSFTWQITDFNTSMPNAPFPDPAVQPVVDPATFELTVNFPGFWFVFASVQANQTTPAMNIAELGVEFLKNGSASPQQSRSSTHNVTAAGDPTHTLDASAGMFLAAGDRVGFRGIVRRSAGASPVTFGNRSITLLRMTLS